MPDHHFLLQTVSTSNKTNTNTKMDRDSLVYKGKQCNAGSGLSRRVNYFIVWQRYGGQNE